MKRLPPKLDGDGPSCVWVHAARDEQLVMLPLCWRTYARVDNIFPENARRGQHGCYAMRLSKGEIVRARAQIGFDENSFNGGGVIGFAPAELCGSNGCKLIHMLLFVGFTTVGLEFRLGWNNDNW